jgi:sodium/hydrogen exchanger-like protein 6/7
MASIFKLVASAVLVSSAATNIDEATAHLLEDNTAQDAEKAHRIDAVTLLIFLWMLILTMMSIWFIKYKKYRFVHETGLSLVYGMAIGAVVKFSHVGSGSFTVISYQVNTTLANPPAIVNLDLIDNSTYVYKLDHQLTELTDSIQEKLTFDPEIFFNLFLPPIIFYAGYSLKRVHFFANFGSILVYAFAGTTISTFVVGIVCWGFAKLQTSITFSFVECLFFGAVISATDPVTVLALFHDLGVDVTLYALVFGESALNDAVAIVLSQTVETAIDRGSFSVLAGVDAVGNFVTIFVGSFLLGVGIACLTALFTKFAKSLWEHPLIEASLFLLFSQSSYLLAEAVGFTGIVALLFCGVTQAHYTYHNLSVEARQRTKEFFEILSFLSENFIFLYMGLAVFTFPDHQYNPMFILGAFVGCILGRLFNIYPLSLIINLGRGPNKISLNFQHMLMFAGLRGAIAFALAIQNTSTKARQAMLTTTLLIVISSVILCGSLATKTLEVLNIKVGVKDDDGIGATEFEPSGPAGLKRRPSRMLAPVSQGWYNFDNKYIKPFLTNSQGAPLETTFANAPACCKPFIMFFSGRGSSSQDREDDLESDTDLILDDIGEIGMTEPPPEGLNGSIALSSLSHEAEISTESNRRSSQAQNSASRLDGAALTEASADQVPDVRVHGQQNAGVLDDDKLDSSMQL